MNFFPSIQSSCRIPLLILACFAFPAFGQQLIFKNISDQINLPSHECYNVIQDSRGYIWITTENGLCRYNGNSLTIFNKPKGLPDNGIYFMEEEYGGALRLISSSSVVATINNGRVIPEKYAQAFKKEMTGAGGQRAYLITEIPEGDLINTFEATYLANRNNGKIINLTETAGYKKDLDLIVVLVGKKSHFIKNRHIWCTQKANGKYFIKMLAVNGKKQKEIIIPFASTEIDSRIRISEINGTVFINLQKKLIAIRPDLTCETYDLPGKVLSLYADNENGFWVGLFQKGVYYYKDINRMADVKKSLGDYSVTGTLMDSEGGIWCTTLEKSVYYCNNVYSLSYANIPQLNKIATLLKPVGKEVFVSTSHDNLFAISYDGIFSKPTDSNQNSDYTDIILHDKKWYISNKAYTIAADRSLTGERVIAENYNFPAYAFDTLAGNLYAVNYTGLLRVSNNNGYTLTDISTQGTRTLACIAANAFYTGGNTGLRKINPITNQQYKIPGIHTPVQKLLKASDGRLWIATKGDGLQVMEKHGLRRVRFPKKHDIFFDVAEDSDGTIWASSENGLVSVGSKKTGAQVRQYNLANGLLSNDLGRIAVYGKNLYVSTVDGLCRIDINRMVNKTAPKIYLSSLEVNKAEVNIQQKELVFSHDQNSVTVSFDVLTFKRQQNDILLYRMEGKDSLWTGSSGNELHFNNLAPNTYKLVVYALNNDGYRSKAPVILEFTIEKPFWQQLWFVFLCIVTAGTVLYFSVKRTIYSIREKEKEKTRVHTLIAQSQLSALQAQMNPHFIFNAISSIQNYILKNKEKEAYDYLAKFGKLIRMVLNNSRESTLPLCQELEMLQTYVQLEQLRFKNSFDFVLGVDEKVDAYNTYLPTMLIQPYIENAIWHGLMNLEDLRKGILNLHISADQKLLKIVIEDNGIGRDRANEFKKDALHHSIGMQLTEQRLQTIYKLKEYEGITIDIMDLKDNAGESLGTRVILLLPLNI
ncbi:MAG TPA: histidine kinase [Flavobacterium sp.]|nr:histidine kinase [Flavobacterium sp.]